MNRINNYFLLILFLSITYTTFAQKYQSVGVSSIKYDDSKSLEENTVHFLIKGEKSDIKAYLKDNGGKLKGSVNDIHSVSLPKKNIKSYISKTDFHTLEYHPSKGTILMDTALIKNNIDSIYLGLGNLPSPLRGDSMIIGIIDTGIDFTHPAFIGTLGRTRVLNIWDQNVTNPLLAPVEYEYGSEWTKQDIDNGVCTHLSASAHGTFVAGIAAGNAYYANRGFIPRHGIAPQSDLIIVSVKLNNDFLGAFVDAVDYIFKKADEYGKPCVINSSVGDYGSYHDGQDLYTQYIEGLLDQKGGRVLIQAAGNGGERKRYLNYELSSDTLFTWFKRSHIINKTSFLIQADTNDFKQAYFEFQCDKKSGFIRQDATPFYNIVNDFNLSPGEIITKLDTLYTTDGTIACYVNITASIVQSRYEINCNFNGISSAYYIRFSTTGSGSFHCYSSIESGVSFMEKTSNLPSLAIFPEMINYVDALSEQSIVGYWNCSEKVISVGNYTNTDKFINYYGDTLFYANNNDLASSTSFGPTRTGIIKPDITATGNVVVSPFPRYIAEDRIVNGIAYLITADTLHGVDGGTSSASPMVAGLAALYLELNPNATYAEVKQAILDNAKVDSYVTQPLPNNQWGYGKLNGFQVIENALIYGCTNPLATNYDSTAHVDNGSCWALNNNEIQLTPIEIYPNPTRNTVFINLNSQQNLKDISVVDLTGKICFTNHFELNSNVELNLNKLAQGVYWINIRNEFGTIVHSEKIVKL